MKAKEFLKEDDIDLHALDNAVESWMEMQSDYRDIVIIQTHPHSQQFKKIPPIKNLYRTLVPGDENINQLKSTGDFVAYSYKIEGAQEFADSLDLGREPYIIVQKDFHPEDFILHFTALYEDRFSYGRSASEFEVWMKPTPYYTKYKKSEIVYVFPDENDDYD